MRHFYAILDGDKKIVQSRTYKYRNKLIRNCIFPLCPSPPFVSPQMVTVKNITLSLDEELLLKALKFAGITRSDSELEKMDESVYEAQRALIASTTTATRSEKQRVHRSRIPSKTFSDNDLATSYFPKGFIRDRKVLIICTLFIKCLLIRHVAFALGEELV